MRAFVQATHAATQSATTDDVRARTTCISRCGLSAPVILVAAGPSPRRRGRARAGVLEEYRQNRHSVQLRMRERDERVPRAAFPGAPPSAAAARSLRQTSADLIRARPCKQVRETHTCVVSF